MWRILGRLKHAVDSRPMVAIVVDVGGVPANGGGAVEDGAVSHQGVV